MTPDYLYLNSRDYLLRLEIVLANNGVDPGYGDDGADYGDDSDAGLMYDA